MRMFLLCVTLLGWLILSPRAGAQSDAAAFPLAGDWVGAAAIQGAATHLALHISTTPEGKMTALLDDVDKRISGAPAIGGSFDGTHLTLRFAYWKPNSDGDLEEKVASYAATVNASGSELTGVWTQEGSWPLDFKRITWQARIPRPAPPTIFDGDWTGVEDEGKGRHVHMILHIHNTEDGLRVLLDCPEEKLKGALASKAAYDEASRALSIYIFQATFEGKMTADGKALDTSMTEPGFHFLIHFDRTAPDKTQQKESDPQLP